MTAEESTFWETSFWEATLGRDSRMDGFFFYAVVSTGVYCRPSCPSRRPRRANVVFFREREAAERAGFRRRVSIFSSKNEPGGGSEAAGLQGSFLKSK